MKFSMLMNMKMLTKVGIFIFISRDEHEKSCITSGLVVHDEAARLDMHCFPYSLLILNKISWTESYFKFCRHKFYVCYFFLVPYLFCTKNGQKSVKNPIALRAAKTPWNFGWSVCKR